MNIIILGAAGFIGTNLALELSKNKEDCITLIDRNENKLNTVKKLCKSDIYTRKIDLSSKSKFDAILEGQDIVYHLLSSTVPTTSNQRIPEEINDNVKLTADLLEACVRCNIKKIVFLSSGGTVYGFKNKCPLTEEMETYPINSYGMQKVMNEKLLYLYHYIYGLDYRIIRLANPFGPFQKSNGVQGVITTFLYKALKKENIYVYGDGSVVRDYIYIDDAIRAIVNIARSETEEKVFNIGSGKGIDINQLIEIIERTLEIKLEIKYLPARKEDVLVNFLDISRYEKAFGTLITVTMEEGIQKTVEFIKERQLSRH